MQLLIATTNPSKLAEILQILGPVPCECRSLAQFPHVPEAAETGTTFAENARMKAIHYSTWTGLPAVAEDSGFEVDALDGAPGVRSARYNGHSYPEKFRAIYDELAARGVAESAARFVCALSLAEGSIVRFETQGLVRGLVARQPRGTSGFGYDPIFYYPPYGRTLAEVSAQEKAAISHRGMAFRAFGDYLRARAPDRSTP